MVEEYKKSGSSGDEGRIDWEVAWGNFLEAMVML